MKTKSSVMVCEDHQIFRAVVAEVIRQLPFISKVGEAGDGVECLALLEKESFDLVLLDISMPIMDGLTCLLEIKKKWPMQRVVILSQYGEYGFVKRALDSGAEGYMTKNLSEPELALKMEAILINNQRVLSEEARLEIRHDITKELIHIGDSEFNILNLMSQDLSSEEIADRLNLSVHTVCAHRKALLKKTQSKTSLGLVEWAHKHGITESSYISK